MNTLHHLLYAGALASGVSRNRRERQWIMISAILPDIDGLTFWNRDLWETVHHTFGHNLFFAGATVAASLAIAGPGRRASLALWSAFSIVFVHYGLDLAISATWPFRPLWPLSRFDVNPGAFLVDPSRLDWWLRVPVQWALVAIAIALAIRTWRVHKRSAIELLSGRLDQLVAGYLARTLVRSRCDETGCNARAGFRCASCHALLCGAHTRLARWEAACADCRASAHGSPS